MGSEMCIRDRYNAMIKIISVHGPTNKVRKTNNAYLHLYDKEERKNRKLGHITITSNSHEELKESISNLKEYLP